MLLCACSCCLVAAPGDLCLACVYACQVDRMGRKNAVMSSLNCYLTGAGTSVSRRTGIARRRKGTVQALGLG